MQKAFKGIIYILKNEVTQFLTPMALPSKTKELNPLKDDVSSPAIYE